MNSKKTALVTGSNGFIGSHLVENLVRDGYSVNCMIRKTSDQRWIKDVPKKCVYADFTDASTLRDAVEEADEIYHLGGAVRTVFPRSIYEINSGGTRNLTEAVRKFNPGISRFVYVSSQAAWGPCGKGPVSHYGKSKLDAERWVKELPGWAVVRPAAVYGPRDRDFLTVFSSASKGLFVKPGGAGLLSFIHVSDCVNGIRNAPVGKETFLSDGNVYRWEDVARALSRAVDRKVRCIHVPAAIVRLLGVAGSAAGMISGCPSLLSFDKTREILAGDWTMPEGGGGRYELYDGFRDTYIWYIEKGWLK